MDIAVGLTLFGVGVASLITALVFFYQTTHKIKMQELEEKFKEDLKKLIEQLQRGRVLPSRDTDTVPSKDDSDDDTRRNISVERRLIEMASKYNDFSEIRVIGINSLGVLHQARESIIDLINSGKVIKFLLLDHNSEAYRNWIENVERVTPNGTKEDYNSHKKRLDVEWYLTITYLRDIATHCKNSKGSLCVRVRFDEPEFAMVAAVGKKDRARLTYVTNYPERGRALRGQQYLCRASKPAEKPAYEKAIRYFDKHWGKINLDYDIWDEDSLIRLGVKK